LADDFRKSGFNAKALDGGLDAWEEAGYPLGAE